MENFTSLSGEEKKKKKKRGGTWQDKEQFDPLKAHIINLNMQ